MIILPILTSSLTHFCLKGWENVLFQLGSGRVKIIAIPPTFVLFISLGLTIIAVGVANYVLAQLEMIATDPKEHVFTVDDFDGLVDLVKSIRKKTCDGKEPLLRAV